VREPGSRVEDKMDDAEQGMVEHARFQQLHDASVVDGLSSRSSGEGLVVRWAILCDELAQFVNRTLVNHAMGRDGQVVDFWKVFHRKAEEVAMLDAFGVQLVKDSQRGLGTLVFTSLELSCQV
jgi:hypothetical protein